MTEKRYRAVGANLKCSNGMEYMLVKRNDGFCVCQVCSKYTAKEIVDELNNLAEENELINKREETIQKLESRLSIATQLLKQYGLYSIFIDMLEDVEEIHQWSKEEV